LLPSDFLVTTGESKTCICTPSMNSDLLVTTATPLHFIHRLHCHQSIEMDPVQWRNKLESNTEFGSTNKSGSGTHIHHGTAISIPTLLFALFWTLDTL
jgi:hypothetical protein